MMRAEEMSELYDRISYLEQENDRLAEQVDALEDLLDERELEADESKMLVVEACFDILQQDLITEIAQLSPSAAQNFKKEMAAVLLDQILGEYPNAVVSHLKVDII